jgi:hypothetical protein
MLLQLTLSAAAANFEAPGLLKLNADENAAQVIEMKMRLGRR